MTTCPLFQLVSVLVLLLAPAFTSCVPLLLPLDCSDIYNHDSSRPSGVYTIYPIGATSAVQVHFVLCGTQVEMIKVLFMVVRQISSRAVQLIAILHIL